MKPDHQPFTLEDISLLQETHELECKLARGRDGQGKLPEDFWPTYSAMANSKGGIVILGLKEKQGKFSVQGVLNPQKVCKELFDCLNNPNKVSCNLLRDEDVALYEIEDKTLIIISIPAATRKQKPVYLNNNPLGNTYRRQHEGDRLLDNESVRRMLAEQYEDSRDKRILPHYDLQDIDLDSLRAYRNRLASHKPDHPFLVKDDLAFLHSLGCYQRDRESGKEGLTLAGLLMFGRWTSIQEAVPNYFVDYRENSLDPDQRWADRLVPDGTWSGNLFDFYRRVYPRLISDLKIPFAIKQGQRQDDTAVHQALREALINTLVHADFSGRSAVRVIKASNGFYFYNPGLMRVRPEVAFKGGESDCRNQTLHQLFLMLGLGERAGSGIPKILKGWQSQDWYVPMLGESEEMEYTVLILLLMSLIPESVLEQLTAQFGQTFLNLNKQERTAIVMATVEKKLTHQRLQAVLKLHSSDISLLLRQLVEKGLLRKHGHARGTVYTVAGTDVLTPDNMLFEPLQPSSEPLRLNSEPLQPSSEPLRLNSEPLHEGKSIKGLDAPYISQLNDIEPSLRQQFEFISQQAKSAKKLPREQLEKCLLQLCAQHYLSLKVLAELLNRSEDYLRLKYLNPMVEAQKLRRAFPVHPNDPRQAYRKVEPE